MTKTSFLFSLILLFSTAIHAQELNCNVIINTDAITTGAQVTDKNIYKKMKSEFEKFMNTRRWTDDTYEEHEKIVCNIAINITSRPNISTFIATAQIQSLRPVYGTNYESLVLNFVDKNFDFTYLEDNQLEFNENIFRNDITSMLGFYAYLFIGLDRDSFSKTGGSKYIDKARDVASNAQLSGNSGWKSDNSRNRFQLVDNLTNQQFLPFREGMYSYHRLAMDQLGEKPKEGQTIVLDLLKNIQQIRRVAPVSILLDSFFDAKADEMINIFKEAERQVKFQSYTLLKNLDPLHTQKYQNIIRSN